MITGSKDKGKHMKKKTGILTLLLLILFVILPVHTVKAEENTINLIAGEEAQLPNTFWFSKFSSSDPNVVTVDANGVVTAVHPGTTIVKQTTLTAPVEYQINVTNVVDIVVAMGQSNMCGSGGDILESPEVSGGVHWYQNNVLSPMKKQGTLLPAFGNAYYKQTGVPVIVIQTAVGGSSSKAWLRDGLITNSVKQLRNCKKHLAKYNVTVRHIYMLWFQGETDAKKGVGKTEYMNNLNKIFKKMKAEGTEKFLMIQIGQYRDRRYDVSTIISAQQKICKKNKNFEMVSTSTKSLSKKTKWYKDNVHFNQKALNKIGTEAGKKAGKLAK